MSTATAPSTGSTTTTGNVGAITQILGSIFDAQFPENQLPAIYNAVKLEVKQGDKTIT